MSFFIGSIASLYGFKYPTVLTYMLQGTEYRAGPYVRWFWRTQHFGRVMRRRQLDQTPAAHVLLWSLRTGMALQAAAGLAVIAWALMRHVSGGWEFGLALLLSYPVVWAHLVALPVWLGRLCVVAPRERRLVHEAARLFANHPGQRLAIAGSYGKTSMKELLATVLSEGKKVAATPANKNVALSHARFVKTLDGDEDMLIIEYGEGKPGDVARFNEIIKPTRAIITGLAPAHLDRYKTLQAAGEDIFSAARFVGKGKAYVNADSPATKPFMRKAYQTYGSSGALGWTVRAVQVTIEGTSFEMVRDGRVLKLHSTLLGRHQLGPLSLAAALALEFGLTEAQVVAGIAKTSPYEHRMQPYRLNGAWIIDDTYNGNIEGIRAGSELLRELSANRKVYVTPGLVDQGSQAAKVHEQMGGLIAAAAPDLVVLMQNSATKAIRAGLDTAGFGGEVRVEADPLHYYTNLKEYVAAGDVILMQNDWTDNYA